MVRYVFDPAYGFFLRRFRLFPHIALRGILGIAVAPRTAHIIATCPQFHTNYLKGVVVVVVCVEAALLEATSNENASPALIPCRS